MATSLHILCLDVARMHRASAIWMQHRTVDRDQFTRMLGLFEATKTLQNLTLQLCGSFPASRGLELGSWRDWFS
jgi:hypothetical protein